MNVARVQSSLDALIKAKKHKLQQQKKIHAEERLNEMVKSAVRSVLPDIRCRTVVNKTPSDEFSVIDCIHQYSGDLFIKDSVWAPWRKV